MQVALENQNCKPRFVHVDFGVSKPRFDWEKDRGRLDNGWFGLLNVLVFSPNLRHARVCHQKEKNLKVAAPERSVLS